MAETEAQYQERATQLLTALGYTVLTTSARSFGTARKSALAKVHAVLGGYGVRLQAHVAEALAGAFATSKGYGADKGVPDLLVLHKDWPRGAMFAAEVKGVATKVSPEQRAMEAQGFYGVYRAPSVYAMLLDLAAFHNHVGAGMDKPVTASRIEAFVSSNIKALSEGKL